MNIRRVSIAALLGLATGASAQNSLFIAHDTQQPIKEFTKGGAFVTDWGESMNVNATGPAVGDGHVYSTNPNSTSTIYRFDASDTFVDSDVFVGGADPNGLGLPGWVEDAAYAGNNELWIGGYNGMVSHIDSSGNILFQFNTKTSYTGVAFDGKTLYTTRGFNDGSGIVDLWDTLGNSVGSISTGVGASGGIGWDSDDNTLWIGYLDSTIAHFDMSGTNLNDGFATGFGGAIDGLELGRIPTPGAAALLGLGGLVAGRRRR